MKKEKTICFIGMLFSLVVGTLLHFADESLGGGIFSIIGSVNESTWEHLKLVFFPSVIFLLPELFIYTKRNPALIPAKAISVVVGMLCVVTLFYTYSGILGKNYAIINILTFVIGVVLMWFVQYKLMTSDTPVLKSAYANVAGTLLLIGLTICFAVFTTSPPDIGLFSDPLAK